MRDSAGWIVHFEEWLNLLCAFQEPRTMSFCNLPMFATEKSHGCSHCSVHLNLGQEKHRYPVPFHGSKLMMFLDGHQIRETRVHHQHVPALVVELDAVVVGSQARETWCCPGMAGVKRHFMSMAWWCPQSLHSPWNTLLSFCRKWHHQWVARYKYSEARDWIDWRENAPLPLSYFLVSALRHKSLEQSLILFTWL